MTGIKLHSNVESMTKVMPRIEALYYFVYELAQSFHADERALESIKKGILDNQILSTIFLRYLNSEGKKAAEVKISIDWEKHTMLAQTDSGKEIRIDMTRSIVDNVVGWRKYVVAHIDSIVKQYGIKKVSSAYWYRESIRSNKEEYQRAMKILNHVERIDPTGDEIDTNLQIELANAMSDVVSKGKVKGEVIKKIVDCGEMEEVSVEVSYIKRP